MRTLFIILLIAIIVGFFTVPSQTKFNNYLVKKGKDAGKCIGANSTRHYSYKIFSMDYVEYCQPASHTDKYLGLFGMFFKL